MSFNHGKNAGSRVGNWGALKAATSATGRPRRPGRASRTRVVSAILPVLETLEDRRLLSGYTVTDIGTFGGGLSLASQINANGVVTGTASDASGNNQAFVYQNGTLAQVGSLGTTTTGSAINDGGEVVGTYDNLSGFVYGNTGTQDINSNGGSQVSPTGINDSGIAVGNYVNAADVQRPFEYDSTSQQFTDIFGAANPDIGYAAAINATGQIAGSDIIGGNSYAYQDSNGTFTYVTAAGGPVQSEGDGINANGDMTGWTDLSGQPQPYLFANGQLTDLGNLGGGSGVGYSVNDSDVVVGVSDGDAFIYSNGTMTDLNTLIPADSGWTLLSAQSINDAGQIAGYGIYNGEINGFLLNPALAATTLSTSDSQGTFGGSATLTATLDAGAAPVANEAVTFSIASTVLGTTTTNSNGVASLPIALAMDAATYSVQANFAGDSAYAASSANLNLVVGQATPDVSVSDFGGGYTGNAYTATAATAGVGNVTLPAPSLAYYAAGDTTFASPLGGAPSDAGDYVVVASSAATTDYTAASATAGFSITPYAFAYTIGNDSQTYGTAANLAGDLGTTIPTGIGSQTLDIAYSSTGDTNTAAPGNYPITGVLSSGSGLLGDYSVALTTGSLTVTGSTLISGVVSSDMTGNGQSADDTPMSNVVVKLYNDVVGNGILEPADGAAIASATTTANGQYAFANEPAGKYIVGETVPGGYVQTAPALPDNYAVALATGSSVTALNFDNYHIVTSNLQNVTYTISGGATVSNLRGNTAQGKTVTAHFTVAAGSAAQPYSFVTYNAPDPTFNASDASQQTIYQVATGTFGPGTYSLTVTIPSNYYQIDFVAGPAINQLGPAGSNIFYSAQDRLISADNAGTHSDVDDESATMLFWANLGQSLIKSFGGSSTSTALGSWLATTMPNVFGGTLLGNLTNTTVAAKYMTFYSASGQKNQAQVMATALNVYASTLGLGGTAASTYGFNPTAAGLGAAEFQIGSNGSAFGVANNSTITVSQMLAAVNSKSSNDVLYNGVSSLLNQCYNELGQVNGDGSIV